MKILLIRLLVWGLRLLYAPMKLRKTKPRVVWLSRQADQQSGDMAMLSAEIKKQHPEYEQIFRLRRLRDGKNASVSYLFGLIGDMWHIAGATLAVTDTYSIPLSCLHHKSTLKVVQIWHALAAVKQFGWQSVGKPQGRDRAVSQAMCMHKGYHAVIAPSPKTAEYFCGGFGCDPGVVKIASLPRVDELMAGDSRREEFDTLNPWVAGKRLVVYLPTFRDGDEQMIAHLHQSFTGREDVALIVSPHPLSRAYGDERYRYEGQFSSYDLMKLSDGLITDYSACSVEGSLLGKPLWFYLPDYDRYEREQGLNVNIKAWFPTAWFDRPEDLIRALDEPYDFTALTQFAQTFVTNQGTNNTHQLAKLLCDLVNQ